MFLNVWIALIRCISVVPKSFMNYETCANKRYYNLLKVFQFLSLSLFNEMPSSIGTLEKLSIKSCCKKNYHL